jgi:hypothetical protein
MRVTVTPVIGMVSGSRLDSLRGCHALHEQAVTKAFHGPSGLDEAITAALYDIALSDAAGRKVAPLITERSYLIQFKE